MESKKARREEVLDRLEEAGGLKSGTVGARAPRNRGPGGRYLRRRDLLPSARRPRRRRARLPGALVQAGRLRLDDGRARGVRPQGRLHLLSRSLRPGAGAVGSGRRRGRGSDRLRPELARAGARSRGSGRQDLRRLRLRPGAGSRLGARRARGVGADRSRWRGLPGAHQVASGPRPGRSPSATWCSTPTRASPGPSRTAR